MWHSVRPAPGLLLLLWRNNSPSVDVVCVCVYVCCHTVKPCLLLLQSVLHPRGQLSFVAQAWNMSACQRTRSHDTNPVNLPEDSQWENTKTSRWWPQRGDKVKADSSGQRASTQQHQSDSTHDPRHMSASSLCIVSGLTWAINRQSTVCVLHSVTSRTLYCLIMTDWCKQNETNGSEWKKQENTSYTVALSDFFLMSAGRTSVSDTTWPDFLFHFSRTPHFSLSLLCAWTTRA